MTENTHKTSHTTENTHKEIQKKNSTSSCDDLLSLVLGLGTLVAIGYGIYKIFIDNGNSRTKHWKSLTKYEQGAIDQMIEEGLL